MDVQVQETTEQEFSLDIFNMSQESDEIEILLDEAFEASISDAGRRC